MSRLALLVDIDRCSGCRSCVVACKVEHDLPPGVSGIRVEQIGPEGTFPELHMYFLPLACQHCREPACTEACPTEALRRGEDGLVVVTEDCTGCGDCVERCPYGAIFLDAKRSAAFKCDLCHGLRKAGGEPACVKACPGRALSVMDLEAVDAGGLFALKAEGGTGPTGRFRLRRQRWKGLP